MEPIVYTPGKTYTFDLDETTQMYFFICSRDSCIISFTNNRVPESFSMRIANIFEIEILIPLDNKFYIIAMTKYWFNYKGIEYEMDPKCEQTLKVRALT